MADYNKYHKALDDMQSEGNVNMFGAPAELVAEFPELRRSQAVKIVSEWMKKFLKVK